MPTRDRTSNYLVYRAADGQQHVVVWDTIDIQVGRHETQDIVIPGVEVSREHALFRCEEGRHLVKDRGTGIGTLVNGERITVCELQPGDVISIGAFEFTFGRTDKPIRPNRNTRYASELKSGFEVPAAAGGGGRTMLAFEMDEPGASSPPTAAPPSFEVARAVSADGTLEEAESDDPLGLSLNPATMVINDSVRDLDLELGDSVPTQAMPPPPLPDLPSPAAAQSHEKWTEPASAARPPRLTLVLEIEPATFEIAALVTALYGKQIGHPLLRIRIKKPGEF